MASVLAVDKPAGAYGRLVVSKDALRRWWRAIAALLPLKRLVNRCWPQPPELLIDDGPSGGGEVASFGHGRMVHGPTRWTDRRHFFLDRVVVNAATAAALTRATVSVDRF
jgi:hypothetical protein